MNNKEILKKSTEELVDEAIKDINCHKHLDDYKDCLDKHDRNRNFKDCVKFMNYFKYCLLYHESNK